MASIWATSSAIPWLGFDICEVASAEWGYYDDARLRELKACADHNGLGITYSIGLEAKYDLASDDPAVRENGIRHVTRILESMPKVGATILNGVSYAGWQALPDHGITLDEKRRKEELALESMSRLMKVAENCGVLYCCEVVNRFEQMQLRRIIFSIDPKAFVVSSKAYEVIGEGFKSHK